MADGDRVATGLGEGIGDHIFTGALREARKSNVGIEEVLLLRPFPQGGTEVERRSLWTDYRTEIISHAGIVLFLFGNKETEAGLTFAGGIYEEFNIALQQGAVVIPVGATGSVARELSETILENPDQKFSALGGDVLEAVKVLAKPTADLMSLVGPIIEIIRKLQGKIS